MSDSTLGCYSSKEKALKALQDYIDKLVDEELLADFKSCCLSRGDGFFDLGFRIEILALDQRSLYSVDEYSVDDEQKLRTLAIFVSKYGYTFKEVEL